MTTLIVGLGNPGEKYRFTRHNSGFLALEELSARWNIPLNQKGFRSVYGKGLWEGRQVVLSQPQTYMNASGGAVRDIAAFFKIIPQNIIVIHDDLDFPLGIARLKSGGGHGGHKGLISVINELGTADFIRLRVGIDKPQYDVEGFVLKPFNQKQLNELAEVLSRIAQMVETVITDGMETGMNRWHGRS